jgi:integrase
MSPKHVTMAVAIICRHRYIAAKGVWPMKRTGNDLIFRRPQSAMWCVRLRDADGRRFIRSLGTADKTQAQIAADPLIREHRERMLAARPRLETKWERAYDPGQHTGPGGERITASDDTLIICDAEGKFLRTEANRKSVIDLVGTAPLTVHGLAKAYIEADAAAFGPPRTVVKTNGDDTLLLDYLDHGGKHRTGVHGHFRHEAESVWRLLKRLTNNKPLVKCDRDDAYKLVEHYQAEGLAKPTIRKKLMWLSAVVNHAVRDSKWKGVNPFAGVAPKDTPQEKRLRKRLPFDADMLALCKQNLGRLSEPDQLLFRLLACTGMRLSEAFEIDREHKREGVRFVNIGRKSELSIRDVPFPADVLPYLPAKVTEPLFAGTSAAASKRLNRFVRSLGLTDTKLVLYSLRHRAETRLIDADCPDAIRQALLGHEEGKTIGEGYQTLSMGKLKSWIDRIGM